MDTRCPALRTGVGNLKGVCLLTTVYVRKDEVGALHVASIRGKTLSLHISTTSSSWTMTES